MGATREDRTLTHQFGRSRLVALGRLDDEQLGVTVVPRTFAELVGLVDWVIIGTVAQVTSAIGGGADLHLYYARGS